VDRERADRERAAETAARDAAAARRAGGTGPNRGPAEDYGLLAVAAVMDTPEEVATVRRLLTAAGIRNTNTVAPNGRHKVLVFGNDLLRARRVAGGSQGAGGSATGSGGS
jgi:hypothetical protein